MSAKVIIYSTTYCPYCVRAKALFDRKGVVYTEIFVDADDAKREEMISKSQRMTVPQIFINDQHIGGCDDLYALDRAGELNPLLEV